MAARPGLASAAKRADREAARGGGRGARRLVAALVELRCETDFVAKTEEFVSLVDEIAARVAAEGEGAVDAFSARIETLLTTLKENISIGRVVRLEAPGPARSSTPTMHQQAGRGVNGVAIVARGRSTPRARPRDRGPHRLHQAAVPDARRRARRRRRRRARATIEEISPQRGQARGGAAQDHRGPAERLVQGARPARAGLRARREADDRPASRAAPRSSRSPRSSIGRLSGPSPARPQDVGRGPRLVGERRDHRRVDGRPPRRGDRRGDDAGDIELAVVIGGGNIWRGATGEMAGIDRATSDTMGMLGHRHQRPGVPGRAREARPPDPRAVGAADGPGRRALHPAARDPPPREGPRRHLRRRHGQPVLHDRHPGGPARRGDRGRDAAQGHPRGRRRRLLRGPADSTRPPCATTRCRSTRSSRRSCASWT